MIQRYLHGKCSPSRRNSSECASKWKDRDLFAEEELAMMKAVGKKRKVLDPDPAATSKKRARVEAGPRGLMRYKAVQGPVIHCQ